MPTGNETNVPMLIQYTYYKSLLGISKRTVIRMLKALCSFGMITTFYSNIESLFISIVIWIEPLAILMESWLYWLSSSQGLLMWCTRDDSWCRFTSERLGMDLRKPDELLQLLLVLPLSLLVPLYRSRSSEPCASELLMNTSSSEDAFCNKTKHQLLNTSRLLSLVLSGEAKKTLLQGNSNVKESSH